MGASPAFVAEVKGVNDDIALEWWRSEQQAIAQPGEHVDPTNFAAPVGVDEVTGLMTAVIKKRCDIAYWVLSREDTEVKGTVNVPNLYGTSPMLCAAINADFDMLRLLFAHGGDLTIPNNEGLLPFHSACERGRLEIVLWMHEKLGSSSGQQPHLTCTNNYGHTPMGFGA